MNKTERFFKHWVRSCLGKVRFSSREQANQACVKNAAKFKIPPSVYQCKLCLGYHLTTKV